MSNPTLDCRGQICPAPILATARAARQLGVDGGILEILADDDAFELDLRSWCRSSGALVLQLDPLGQGYRALIQVASQEWLDEQRLSSRPPSSPAQRSGLGGIARPRQTAERSGLDGTARATRRAELPVVKPSAAPAAKPAPKATERTVDCRGLQCPAPILEVARVARKHPGIRLEVLADDDAFEFDITSWCRSGGAVLETFEQQGDMTRAIIQLKAFDADATRRLGRRKSDPAVQAVATTETPPPPSHATDTIARRPIDLSYVGMDGLEQALDMAAREQKNEQLLVQLHDTSFTPALLKWSAEHGHQLSSLNGTEPVIAEILLRRGAPPVTHEASIIVASDPTELAISTPPKEKKAAIFILNSEKEALLAALLVANGAAAQGMKVTIFFSFWALNLLRGDRLNKEFPKKKVAWSQKMFKWMMPKGPRRQGLGKLNFGGMGTGMMNSLMKKHNIMDVPDLLDAAQEQDIRFIACTMSMSVMGVTKRELHPYPNLRYGGIAAFVEAADGADLSLSF